MKLPLQEDPGIHKKALRKEHDGQEGGVGCPSGQGHLPEVGEEVVGWPEG